MEHKSRRSDRALRRHEVVKDWKELFLHENESIYVPKSRVHRVENPGKMELHIIKVQTGGYLEEDDIVRIEGDTIESLGTERRQRN